jgi:hypothetical protein
VLCWLALQVRLCTAHLESRDFDGFSPPLRKAQLTKMFNLLDGAGTSDEVALRIITGDFNFPAGSKEEEVGLALSLTHCFTGLQSDQRGNRV